MGRQGRDQKDVATQLSCSNNNSLLGCGLACPSLWPSNGSNGETLCLACMDGRIYSTETSIVLEMKANLSDKGS